MSKKRPILVFGGAFNPPHVGHMGMVNAAMSNLIWTNRTEMDKVILVPSGNPPHKTDLLPADDRIQMLKYAAEDLNYDYEIDEFETASDEKSYTYKTLEYLKDKHECLIYLLMGSDQAWTFKNSWKNVDRILELAMPIAVQRGVEIDGKSNIQLCPDSWGGLTVGGSSVVSSTKIRTILQKSDTPFRAKGIKRDLNPKVALYIENNGLYESDIIKQGKIFEKCSTLNRISGAIVSHRFDEQRSEDVFEFSTHGQIIKTCWTYPKALMFAEGIRAGRDWRG